MTPESLASLHFDGLEPISVHSEPSWRHGTRETWVFEVEGEFWEARFRLSTDGETDELEDGLAKIQQVYPTKKVQTVYVSAPQAERLPDWFELVSFWVDGEPKGQPRGRAVVVKGKGQAPTARIFTPNTAEAWRGDLLRCGEPFRPPEPIREACRLDLDLYFARPKRLMRKKDREGPIRYDKAPDVDNAYKAAADALETMGWYDKDARVSETLTRCFFHSKTGRPGCRVRLMVEVGSRAHALSIIN